MLKLLFLLTWKDIGFAFLKQQQFKVRNPCLELFYCFSLHVQFQYCFCVVPRNICLYQRHTNSHKRSQVVTVFLCFERNVSCAKHVVTLMPLVVICLALQYRILYNQVNHLSTHSLFIENPMRVKQTVSRHFCLISIKSVFNFHNVLLFTVQKLPIFR